MRFPEPPDAIVRLKGNDRRLRDNDCLERLRQECARGKFLQNGGLAVSLKLLGGKVVGGLVENVYALPEDLREDVVQLHCVEGFCDRLVCVVCSPSGRPLRPYRKDSSTEAQAYFNREVGIARVVLDLDTGEVGVAEYHLTTRYENRQTYAVVCEWHRDSGDYGGIFSKPLKQ